ncbi:MAG: proteasome subunit beta [Egibacteraceae bacterium]
MRIPRSEFAYPQPFDIAVPSFSAFLRRLAPEAHIPVPPSGPGLSGIEYAEGTTVVALAYEAGVVMAGDRRATAGSAIVVRDTRKIFEADAWSAIGIAGAAGPAMEMAKLFATQLENYEKIEGTPLSLEGKANALARMVYAHLPMAMQGMVVVPLFAGYERSEGIARIYEFDPLGGHYEERRFATTGSGGRDARGSMKARYREGLNRETAVDMVIEALWDAADEDSATGGPDLVRQIYPLVAVIDADGYRELTDQAVATRVETVIAARRQF